MIDPWSDLIAKGRASFHDLQKAEEYFSAAYDLACSNGNYLLKRGESAYFLAHIQHLLGSEEKSMQLYEESLNFLSKDTDKELLSVVHSVLGMNCYEQKRYKEAESHFRESIELQPTPSSANLQGLSAILVLNDQYEEATIMIEQLLPILRQESSPELVSTLRVLASCYKKLDRIDDATEVRKELIRLNDKDEHYPRAPLVYEGERPEGWGTELISQFIESAIHNQFATFQNDQEKYKKLAALNNRFWESIKNLRIRVADIAAEKRTEHFDEIFLEHYEWLEMYFFLRAHSSFLGTIRFLMSGQITESYMVLRGCLENALYAQYVAGNDSRKEIWLKRHESADALRACRREFSNSRVEDNLTQHNQSLGDRTSDLYDITIDKGAHPNVQAFLNNAFQKNERNQIVLSVSYLNPDQFDEAFENTMLAAECVLEIFNLVFPSLIAD